MLFRSHDVFSLQRRAVRIVAGLAYVADCRSAFRSQKILTFPSLYIYNCLVYAKINESAMKSNGEYHEYHTRNKDKLCPLNIRLTRSKTASRYYSIKFYNVLPYEIKKLSLKLFKIHVKSLLLEMAVYDTNEYLEYFKACKV